MAPPGQPDALSGDFYADASSDGIPAFTIPLPMARSDHGGSDIGTATPSNFHPAAAIASLSHVFGSIDDAAGDSSQDSHAPDLKKIKGKAKQAKSPLKRIKWTNKMVGELLQLRFKDGDVKRRLEAADTKTKKALAWQYFASVLSQSLGIVLNHDQVSLKYRKLKCIYRKEKHELKKTGNDARVSELDESLWTILNDAFGGRVGISGEVLLDSSIDDDQEEEEPKEESASKTKPPVAQLATALQGGMEAIARSLGARTPYEDPINVLTVSLQQQQEENRRFQELQLQLLRGILAKTQ